MIVLTVELGEWILQYALIPFWSEMITAQSLETHRPKKKQSKNIQIPTENAVHELAWKMNNIDKKKKTKLEN